MPIWNPTGSTRIGAPVIAGTTKRLRGTSQDAATVAEVGFIDDSPGQNLALGTGALAAIVPVLNTSGYGHIAIGYHALNVAVNDVLCVGIGYETLSLRNDSAAAAGSVAIGGFACGRETTGDSNIGIGYKALWRNGTGTSNTAVGNFTLNSTANPMDNTAIGSYALASCKGTENIGIGYECGELLTSAAARNICIGNYALLVAGAATRNIAIGWDAGGNVSTGSRNLCLGEQAGLLITTGSRNILIGIPASGQINPTANNANDELNIGNTLYGNLAAKTIRIGAATPGATFHVTGSADATITCLIDGASSQSANLQQWRDSAANILALVDKDGGCVFNENSLDVDCRIEGATDANLFYSDAGADRVGIGTASPGSKLDVAGSLQCDSITNDTGLASGTYTPALTEVANLDASTSVAYECQYLRVGNTVMVSGRVDINPTLTATSTQLGISLPIASNLGAVEDCAGTACSSDIVGQSAAIIGDVTNNRAELRWISGDVTLQPMYFTFTYQVL